MSGKKPLENKWIVRGATIKRKYAKRRHLLGDKAGARNDMTTNIPPTTTSNKEDGIDR